MGNILAGMHPVVTVASVDTIELVLRRPPAGLRRQVEAIVGGRREIKDIVDRTGQWRGVRLIVNRPNRSALKLLSGLVRSRWSGCSVSRVDIAVDFSTGGEEDADALLDWLDQHVILKWRSPASRKKRLEDRRGRRTVYWTDGRPARNLVIYRNRKMINVVRLELRFINAGSVKRAGLDRLEALENLDLTALINHNIKAERFTDGHITKVVRRTYKADLDRHQKRKGGRYHNVTDLYRSHIPTRIKALLTERCDMQETRKGGSTERISTDFLGIPDRVSVP